MSEWYINVKVPKSCFQEAQPDDGVHLPPMDPYYHPFEEVYAELGSTKRYSGNGFFIVAQNGKRKSLQDGIRVDDGWVITGQQFFRVLAFGTHYLTETNSSNNDHIPYSDFENRFNQVKELDRTQNNAALNQLLDDIQEYVRKIYSKPIKGNIHDFTAAADSVCVKFAQVGCAQWENGRIEGHFDYDFLKLLTNSSLKELTDFLEKAISFKVKPEDMDFNISPKPFRM